MAAVGLAGGWRRRAGEGCLPPRHHHMALAWKGQGAAGGGQPTEWKPGEDDAAAGTDSLWYERLLRRRSSDATQPGNKLSGPAVGLRRRLSDAHATYQRAHQAARLARRARDALAKSTGSAMGEEYMRERATMERLQARVVDTARAEATALQQRTAMVDLLAAQVRQGYPRAHTTRVGCGCARCIAVSPSCLICAMCCARSRAQALRCPARPTPRRPHRHRCSSGGCCHASQHQQQRQSSHKWRGVLVGHWHPVMAGAAMVTQALAWGMLGVKTTTGNKRVKRRGREVVWQ